MMSSVLPAFVFFCGAMLVAVLPGRLRAAASLLVPVIGALNLFLLVEYGAFWQVELFDYKLTLLRVDKLSLLFGYLFHLAAFIGVVYAMHVRDATQQVSALLYAGSALGAVFAGDLITLFVFWEILAVTSVFLVWARRTTRAYRAGMRYLLIQIGSGVLLLIGTLIHLHQTGSIAFEQFTLQGPAAWLILLAFGVKCAFPLMHNWLTEAYSEATVVGTVFLSAFTTKVAVYALARGFPGTEILVYVGVVMAAFPIFYAVIENDLRKVLCYSMINQIGFMVVGIGIGTDLALNGAIAHAFNDVVFKGLLFMSMGAVLHMTGKINGSDLGGLYKTMPVTTVLCIVGAASISAFPLFSGFVSKSMVMVAALEQGYDWVWLVLLFAAAGVFHHAGIKIPYFAFFAHDSGLRAKDPPWNMLLAMSIAAAICIFNGSYPWMLYSLLPWPVDYAPYTWSHVITQTQLLFFSALAFIFLQLRGLYPPELRSTNIDAEYFYRRLAPRAIRRLEALTTQFYQRLQQLGNHWIGSTINWVAFLYRPRGILNWNWLTGTTALAVAILLVTYLTLYYA